MITFTSTIEWFDPREKLPEEDGDYLVCINNGMPATFLQFAVNLSDFNNVDFPEELYSHHGGFVVFDETRSKWCKVPIKEIGYWAKIPEIKEEKKDD